MGRYDMMLARFTGSRWLTLRVLPNRGAAGHASLRFDSSGAPQIILFGDTGVEHLR
jgi:hypothetical protein